MLLEIAIGDAYSAGFEYVNTAIIREQNDLSGYLQHPRHGTRPHNTPDGIHAAVAAALMIHYFLYDLGPKAQLGAFLEQHVPGNWSEPWRGKVGHQGIMSVRAAVTSVMANASQCDLLRHCIAYSGDVDTVAAIALAAGSCCPKIAQDLPTPLLLHLENATYGRDYLHDLDRRLLAHVSTREV